MGERGGDDGEGYREVEKIDLGLFLGFVVIITRRQGVQLRGN